MTTPPLEYGEGEKSHLVAMKKLDLESGALGKIFGTEKNAPLNIAGTILILLVAPGVLLLFLPGAVQVMDYWKVVVPVVTAILGYTFGRRG